MSVKAPTRSQDLLGCTIADRYRVESAIGDGGMATVYRATQVHLRRAVALKVLKTRYREDPDSVERFVREARAASAIRSPHVVDILDVGEITGTTVYIAMELLEGPDLEELLAQRGRLNWSRARRLALQMAAGLRAVHEHGIIHRDMKPSNCIVTRDDRGQEHIKILDFGIAKLSLSATEQELTQTGAIFGTAKYMSPEQARGQSVDPRTDIYAFGVILFEMLAGQVPFDGDNFAQVATRHVKEAPPSLAHLNLPPGVQELVHRCLAKEPKHRFSSMRELEKALASLPQTAGANAQAPRVLQPPPIPEGTVVLDDGGLPPGYAKSGSIHVPTPVQPLPQAQEPPRIPQSPPKPLPSSPPAAKAAPPRATQQAPAQAQSKAQAKQGASPIPEHTLVMDPMAHAKTIAASTSQNQSQRQSARMEPRELLDTGKEWLKFHPTQLSPRHRTWWFMGLSGLAIALFSLTTWWMVSRASERNHHRAQALSPTPSHKRAPKAAAVTPLTAKGQPNPGPKDAALAAPSQPSAYPEHPPRQVQPTQAPPAAMVPPPAMAPVEETELSKAGPSKPEPSKPEPAAIEPTVPKPPKTSPAPKKAKRRNPRSNAALARALAKTKQSAAQSCTPAPGVRAKVKVRLQIEASGKVSEAKALPPYNHSAVGACVERIASLATFAPVTAQDTANPEPYHSVQLFELGGSK